MKIYCDMDGVLVNLMGGINELVDEPLLDPYQHPDKIKVDELPWDLVRETPLFWESLDWAEEGQKVWSYLMNTNMEVAILSARTKRDPFCTMGKLKWLAGNISDELDCVHIVERREKADFAKDEHGMPNILIDDYRKNIDEFNAAGGIGILYTDFDNMVEELSAVL